MSRVHDLELSINGIPRPHLTRSSNSRITRIIDKSIEIGKKTTEVVINNVENIPYIQDISNIIKDNSKIIIKKSKMIITDSLKVIVSTYFCFLLVLLTQLIMIVLIILPIVFPDLPFSEYIGDISIFIELLLLIQVSLHKIWDALWSGEDDDEQIL